MGYLLECWSDCVLGKELDCLMGFVMVFLLVFSLDYLTALSLDTMLEHLFAFCSY